MDVTHCPELSPSSFLYVSLDTNSSFTWATPLRGETTRHVITHLLACFTVMRTPRETQNNSYLREKFILCWAKVLNEPNSSLVCTIQKRRKKQLMKVSITRIICTLIRDFLNKNINLTQLKVMKMKMAYLSRTSFKT